MHAHSNARTRTHTCTHTQIHTHACTNIRRHTRMNTRTDTRTHQSAPTHTRMHIHMYTHGRIHKDTVTHVYLHTHILSGATAVHRVQVFPGVHSFEFCPKFAQPVILPHDQVFLFSNSFNCHDREKVKSGVMKMGESCQVVSHTTLRRLLRLDVGLVISPAGHEVRC